MEICKRQNIDIDHLDDGIAATAEIRHNKRNIIAP